MVTTLLQQLHEEPALSTFVVDYFVTTPDGNVGRFTRASGLSQMTGSPRSETAVLNYLRTLHPGTDIQINSLEFR